MFGKHSPGTLTPPRSGRHVRQSWRTAPETWTVELLTPNPDQPRRRGIVDWYVIPDVLDPRVAEAVALDLAGLPEGETFFQCEDNHLSDLWPVISVEVRDRLVENGMLEADMTYDHTDQRVPTGLWKLTMTARYARMER